MAYRLERLESQIKNFAALFLEREAQQSSLITVTNCSVSPDGKRATIYISVLPREKEQAAYGFVKRNLGGMREYIGEHLKTNLPYLDVEIDEGEKKRQRIDELLRE